MAIGSISLVKVNRLQQLSLRLCIEDKVRVPCHGVPDDFHSAALELPAKVGAHLISRVSHLGQESAREGSMRKR